MIRLILILLTAAILPLSAVEPARNFKLTSLYHVGYWTSDIEKSRVFYSDYLGFEVPYVLNRTTGELQMVIMKVNEIQVILLFTDSSKILPNGDNLDHLGLETDNNEALREYMISCGIEMGTVHRARVGDLLLGIKDPDGNVYEVTQLEPEGRLRQHKGKALPPTRISYRLLSASLMVANLPAAMAYYRDILGFKRIDADNHGLALAGIVRLQVPDGTEYLDLVTYDRKPGDGPARRVPEYCLEVEDAAKAAAILTTRARALGFPAPATVSLSPDGRRQTSCIDPDGVRVVLIEAAK